jgi:isoquinoline 1-oxidoreductase
MSSTTTRTISRRTLVQGAGVAAGLSIVWSSAPALAHQEASPAASPAATPESSPVIDRPTPPTTLDAYLRVNEDGTVTLYCGKVEFGQGIETGFRQLIAEELSLPFESVAATMGKTDEAPWDLGTFGSLSMRVTGPRIRQAGAAMHAWLLEIGAEFLGQDAANLSLQDGAVVVTADPATSVAYAELAFGQQSARELDPTLPLKAPETFTVIGQSIPRPDVALKVNGSMKYGIDATVEGMVWAKVVRPPAFGATLTDIDFAEAEAMPGVVGTYRDGDFAGLAAETNAQAEAALAKVKATWQEPATTTTHETIYDLLLNTPDAGEILGEEEENAAAAREVDVVSDLTDPVTLQFRAPYVNHTPIEPRNALVEITADGANVWCSTQQPFAVQTAVAAIVDRDPATVVVTPMAAGGAFGSKVIPMAEVEAATLAREFGRPVKILWRRDEEIAHGQYRPAMLIDITAGLDKSGTIAGWGYDLYSAAYFPEGAEEAQGAAADWSADTREIYGGVAAKTMWYKSHSPLPPYFWRVNGASTNTWARESMMDVLAEKAGLDPVTFRLNHLGDNPRMAALVNAVVDKAGWTPGIGSTGQGIGIALGFDATTYVAEVARVEFDEATNQIHVRHVDVGIDCGLVVNPEAVKHQVEGSVVLGTSAALKEVTTFENGRVTNPTFADYAPITMKESPTVDTIFVEDKANLMGGIGEPAVAPASAAIANAVYDLLGVRPLEQPFTPDRIAALISNRDA